MKLRFALLALLVALPCLAADPIPLPPGQVSAKDPKGRYTMNVDFPNMPVTVIPPWSLGGKDFSISYLVPIGPDVEIVRMTEFIGFDRGDIAEVDLEVRSGTKGAAIMQRSEHKEGISHFDAWHSHDIHYKTSIDDQSLKFILFGHCSGKNLITGEDHARLHWGVRIELQAR